MNRPFSDLHCYKNFVVFVEIGKDYRHSTEFIKPINDRNFKNRLDISQSIFIDIFNRFRSLKFINVQVLLYIP